MKTKVLAVALAIVMALSFAACKKETEAPLTAPGQTEPGAVPGEEGNVFVPEIKETVVPDEVKGAWKAVKLSIEDKQANTTKEVVVNLGDIYTIPDTNIKIKIGDFLPDFKMGEGVVTSVSNEPNNPAVHILVTEGENEIFKNWLYSKFPAIHPFMHERFGITLKEAITAKG